MKNLSKEQKARHLEIVATLRAAYDEMTAATIAFNEARSEASEFCTSIVEGIENYTSERSDAWQDSDAASECETWRDAWDERASNLQDLDMPDEEEIDAFADAPTTRDDA